MPTLYNRIYAYSANNKVPMLSLEKRSDLGIRVMQNFRQSGITKKYKRVKAQVYDYDGLVVYYPGEFRDEMDRLIKDYYDNPPDELISVKPQPKKEKEPEKPPVKKRKKLIRKGESVYSTKSFNNAR